MNEPGKKSRTVIVSGLDKSISFRMIRQSVHEIIARNNHDGREIYLFPDDNHNRKINAWITFKTHEEATKFLERQNNKPFAFGGEIVQVTFTKCINISTDNECTVCVNGLPINLDFADVFDYFASNIIGLSTTQPIKELKRKDGRLSVILQFTSVAEARLCALVINDSLFNGDTSFPLSATQPRMFSETLDDSLLGMADISWTLETKLKVAETTTCECRKCANEINFKESIDCQQKELGNISEDNFSEKSPVLSPPVTGKQPKFVLEKEDEIRTVHIGGLPSSILVEKIKEYFEYEVGEIKLYSTGSPKITITGRSSQMTFAWLTFTKQVDAEYCKRHFCFTHFPGEKNCLLHIRMAISKKKVVPNSASIEPVTKPERSVKKKTEKTSTPTSVEQKGAAIMTKTL